MDLKKPIPQLAMIALAYGIMNGSIWAARGQDVFGSSVFIPLNRVMGIVMLCVIALLARRREIDERKLPFVACIAYAAHVVSVIPAVFITDTSTVTALGLASTFFEGISIAAFELAVILKVAPYGAKRAGTVIAGGLLVGQLYDCIFVNAPSGVCVAQWLIGFLVALGLLIVAGKQLKHVETDTEAEAVQPDSAAVNEGSRRIRTREIVALVICGAVILQIGLFQGLTGFGGIGSAARYGIATDIVMILVRCGILAYVVLAVSPLASTKVSSFVLVGWICSLCLALATWGSEAVVAAEWLRAGMLYALQVLPLVLSIQIGLRAGSNLVTWGAVGVSITFLNQIPRMAGSVAGLGSAANDYHALVAIISSCIFVTVIFVVPALRTATGSKERRIEEGAGSPSDPDSPDCTHDIAVADDGVVARGIDFARRFGAFCDEYHIPAGEQETLLEAIHGYTIDNIAANLGLSRETVKTNLSRAYTRAGVNGKQELLALIDTKDK